jgi:hypothetical protein
MVVVGWWLIGGIVLSLDVVMSVVRLPCPTELGHGGADAQALRGRFNPKTGPPAREICEIFDFFFGGDGFEV